MTAPALTASSRASARRGPGCWCRRRRRRSPCGRPRSRLRRKAPWRNRARRRSPCGRGRSAAKRRARRRISRVGRIAQHRPVDDDRLLALARPFDIGERDRAVRARADRLHQLVADDRRRVAAALQGRIRRRRCCATRRPRARSPRRPSRRRAPATLRRRSARGSPGQDPHPLDQAASDAPARAPRQRAERGPGAASMQVRVTAIGAAYGVRSNSSQLESSVRPCAASA